MFSDDYLKKVYRYYEEDGSLRIASFQSLSLHTLLKTLILYKTLDDSIESYKSDGEEFGVYNYGDLLGDADEPARNKLCFFSAVATLPEWLDSAWKDELMSTFLSRQLVNGEDDDKCVVYIDKERRSTYVSVPKRMSTVGMQSILSGLLPKLVPWFFKDVDKELIRKIATLSNDRNYTEFETFFENTIREAGVIAVIMQKDLESLGERLKSSAKRMIETQIQEYRGEVDSLFRRMCSANDNLREAQNRLSAIMLSDDRDDGVSEIIEFLNLTTQDIEIEAIEDYTIKLRISSTLQQFDEWERYTDMDGCYLYDRVPDDRIPENKRMYKTLFSNPDFKIHTCVGLSMDLKSGYLSCYRPTYTEHESEHPHLNANFNCFGSAMAPIAEYIKSFRYTEALNQIVYAARQFTVSDGAAGEKLLDGMSRNACIELPNGKFVGTDGLREYLNETEGEI